MSRRSLPEALHHVQWFDSDLSYPYATTFRNDTRRVFGDDFNEHVRAAAAAVPIGPESGRYPQYERSGRAPAPKNRFVPPPRSVLSVRVRQRSEASAMVTSHCRESIEAVFRERAVFRGALISALRSASGVHGEHSIKVKGSPLGFQFHSIPDI